MHYFVVLICNALFLDIRSSTYYSFIYTYFYGVATSQLQFAIYFGMHIATILFKKSHHLVPKCLRQRVTSSPIHNVPPFQLSLTKHVDNTNTSLVNQTVYLYSWFCIIIMLNRIANNLQYKLQMCGLVYILHWHSEQDTSYAGDRLGWSGSQGLRCSLFCTNQK